MPGAARTASLFTGVFAAGILHWTPEMVTIQGLCNSVLATCGGLLAGWLDTRIGSRRAVMVFVAGVSSPMSCCAP